MYNKMDDAILIQLERHLKRNSSGTTGNDYPFGARARGCFSILAYGQRCETIEEILKSRYDGVLLKATFVFQLG